MANAMQKKNWNWFRNEDGNNDNRLSQSALPPWRSVLPSLTQMQRDMEQFFDQAIRNWSPFGWPALTALPNTSGALGNRALSLFQPHIDIASNDSEYTIMVEIPGMEEKDIHVEVSPEGLLTISGEKRQRHEDRNKDYERVESSYGSFERSLSLPYDVDQEAIEARFKNGVLTITCRRNESERSRARQIPIAGKSAQGNQGQERNQNQDNENRDQRENRSSQQPGTKKAA